MFELVKVGCIFNIIISLVLTGIYLYDLNWVEAWHNFAVLLLNVCIIWD